MGSDEDESEDFIFIGTPLKTMFETIRKPTPLQDQTVTDEKGRPQRFHGAFTGGFSAGYFNTVGSKEGWTPSSFTSSRNQRAGKKTFQPEQFMDDEDFAEHGIAERKVVAANEFQSLHEARNQQVAAARDPLAELIRPTRSSVGLRLLKKLGWREGQGIGPRTSRRRKNLHRPAESTPGDVKAYGCALPPSAESSDSESEYSENVTFAPRDISVIDFRPKTNQHGLGYSGITYLQSKTVPQSASNILFSRPQPKTIRGQAFGVGDDEDEDDREIYSSRDMTAYDQELGSPEPDDNYGWTAPGRQAPSAAKSLQSVFNGMERVLEGFAKSQLSDSSTVKLFPASQLPRSFKPYHVFATDNTTTAADVQQKIRDAQDRAAVRGEQPDFKSVFELLNDRDRKRLHAACSAVTKTSEKLTECNSAQNTRNALLPAAGPSLINYMSHMGTSLMPATVSVSQAVSTSTAHSQLTFRALNALTGVHSDQLSIPASASISILPSQQSVSSTHSLPGHVIMTSTSSGFGHSSTSSQSVSGDVHMSTLAPTASVTKIFEPFARDSVKQARYQVYLELTRTGKRDAYEEVDTHELTEWERSRERDEFQRAAALYRPLTGLMASRFTRATADDNTNTVSVKADTMVDTSDQAQAAKMNMFGHLTRNTLEWHPDNVLCKRFNVPNPYPESNVVGVPSVKRDKISVFNFLRLPDEVAEEPSNVTAGVTAAELKATPVSAAAMLKPLSILAAGPLITLSPAQPQVAALPIPDVPLTKGDDGVNTGVSETQEERPPMDLFKAIFADDDCAGESSGEEDSRLADTQPPPHTVSGLLPTLPTSTSDIRRPVESAFFDSSLASTGAVLPSGADLTIEHESEVFGPSLPPVAGDTGSISGSLMATTNTKQKRKKEKKEKKKKSKTKSRKHKKHKRQYSEVKEISTTHVVVLSSSQSDDSLSNEDQPPPSLPLPRISRQTAADFL